MLKTHFKKQMSGLGKMSLFLFIDERNYKINEIQIQLLLVIWNKLL